MVSSYGLCTCDLPTKHSDGFALRPTPWPSLNMIDEDSISCYLSSGSVVVMSVNIGCSEHPDHGACKEYYHFHLPGEVTCTILFPVL